MIRRSDGSPLYNLAVAVDDRDMGITHVVRGQDHVSNTPRQLMLLQALGEQPPVYAHIPLLHGPDGKKLSKRHGAASVQELRDAGYLPEAVRNYTALLGWGYDESTTFMTTDELVERFALERVSKNPAVFDEQKLRWMNGRYLRELDRRRAEGPARGSCWAASCRRRPWPSARRRSPTLAEFWPLAALPRWSRRNSTRRPGGRSWATGPASACRPPAMRWRSSIRFDAETIEAALRGVVERLAVKPKEVFQPVRVAISGSTVSPGIFESVEALGREETLGRIDAALRKAKSRLTRPPSTFRPSLPIAQGERTRAPLHPPEFP